MVKPNYYISSFFWSTLSTIINSLIQFISVPLLLKYFDIDNYGILTLAIATNTYMNLLDLGINTGAIKFFAQWRVEGKLGLIDRVSRTSISFYGIIGAINALLLLVVAFLGNNWFEITLSQFQQFRSLLILLAIFSIVNWATSVFSQLLIADERMAFVQQIGLVKTILNLVIVVITLTFKLSLKNYFFLFLLNNSLIIIPYFLKCKSKRLISSFIPQTYWKEFKIVLNYSMAIFAMVLFQATAARSRPILLGIFSNEGIGILTEYRIIEVFPMFIGSIGGILISILLPKASKLVSQNRENEMRVLAYEGTIYTSILTALLCFPIMLCSQELITIYVGATYKYLNFWLSLWCFTLVLYLHNSPVSSLVLATGKTKMLVFSSAIACIVSIIINSILCKKYGVGSAVIGYLIYIIIQQFFYYSYFINKVLDLKSWKVFKSFIVPTGLGMIIFLLVKLINIQVPNQIVQSLIKLSLWGITYIAALALFKIVDYKALLEKLKNK
jgi:O-antigen/teichoic acid export membrane protein